MMKKIKFSLLVISIFFNYNIYSQSASEIAKKSFSSVVMLIMEDDYGQPLKIGSGFFVSNDLIVTNLHVVNNSNTGYIKPINATNKYDIDGYVAIDYNNDLVLLKIRNISSKPLNIGNSDNIEIGEEIFAIGNPQGLEGTISNGIISGKRSIDSKELLQITAPISPGSSGGPILDNKGSVIGVAVSTFKNGQNLNFAVPSKYLLELIKTIGSLKMLNSINRQSSELFPDISSQELVYGDNFLWTYPYCRTCGKYTFTIKNNLRETISNIYCIVIFYHEIDYSPIDIDVLYYDSFIPGNLAKRISSEVDPSTFELSSGRDKDTPYKVEIRILDFRISN